MSSGYTLPVFACASALAALHHLQHQSQPAQVTVNLIKPPQLVSIDIEQVAQIDSDTAIAITRSNPGDHLDLTRNTPIWAKVRLLDSADNQIVIEGGAGIGRQVNHQNQPAIYSYAQTLIQANIRPLLQEKQGVVITIILPKGTQLAKRTSNEAFGVIEGLSLLGTTGIVQPLTAPKQLAEYQAIIKTKASQYSTLVFCIGENGRELAQSSGLDPKQTVKTANWIGSLLVTAALAGVKSVLLFGYHGKLIKLAGGIFHTHNHLADGRREIMTAYCARAGCSLELVQTIFSCPTTEAALELLRHHSDSRSPESDLVNRIYDQLAEAIDFRCQEYIFKYTEQKLQVGCVMFDRQRRVIKKSSNGLFLHHELC